MIPHYTTHTRRGMLAYLNKMKLANMNYSWLAHEDCYEQRNGHFG
jgi:hypothetical protein